MPNKDSYQNELGRHEFLTPSETYAPRKPTAVTPDHSPVVNQRTGPAAIQRDRVRARLQIKKHKKIRVRGDGCSTTSTLQASFRSPPRRCKSRQGIHLFAPTSFRTPVSSSQRSFTRPRLGAKSKLTRHPFAPNETPGPRPCLSAST